MDRQTIQTNSPVRKVEWETFEASFDGFETLPMRRGLDEVETPDFSCFGHSWGLQIYPGGDGHDDGFVSVYLVHKSEERIKAEAVFSVLESDGRAISGRLGPFGFEGHSGGVTNFASRERIVESLVNGDLLVHVQMKLAEPPAAPSLPFVPSNPLGARILKKLFLDEESSDVAFATAPALVEACQLRGDDTTPIPIKAVSPETFRHVLYYAYGGEVSKEVLKNNAKDIIDASDKFGVVGLKLEAEAFYVGDTEISVENVMEHLGYADARNCPLLKESVMDYLVANGDEVVRKVSLTDAPGGLLADILAAMNQGKKKEAGEEKGNGFRFLRVSELRRKLDERGLDVDGSREAMIARLEQSDKVVLLQYPFNAGQTPSYLANATMGMKELNGHLLGVEGAVSNQSTAGAGLDHSLLPGESQISIRKGDKHRLLGSEPLSSELVDFWMRWISHGEESQQGTNSNVHFFPADFISTLVKGGAEAVGRWTSNMDPFDNKFLFLPVIEDLHWSLIVVVNPGLVANNFDEDAPEGEEHAFLFFFDSLRMHSKKTYSKHIRKWLNFEWNRRNRGAVGEFTAPFAETAKRVPMRSPRVPYQGNEFDGGVFVCRYAYALYVMRHKRFTWLDAVEKPSFRSLITNGPAFQFDVSDMARIRSEFALLIDRLSATRTI